MNIVRTPTGWGPLVISRVIRALNWVIRTLSEVISRVIRALNWVISRVIRALNWVIRTLS